MRKLIVALHEDGIYLFVGGLQGYMLHIWFGGSYYLVLWLHLYILLKFVASLRAES